MNYFHASVVVMCYIFIHTYSVNVLIYYLPKPEEIQHRGFKRKERFEGGCLYLNFCTNILKTLGQEIRLINAFALQITFF